MIVRLMTVGGDPYALKQKEAKGHTSLKLIGIDAYDLCAIISEVRSLCFFPFQHSVNYATIMFNFLRSSSTSSIALIINGDGSGEVEDATKGTNMKVN